MCSKTSILVILFIIKILVLLIPIAIYVLKRLNFIEKFIKYFYIAEISFLILLIVLCFVGKDCIKNSTVKGIKLNYSLFNDVDNNYEETALIDYTNINPSKVYKNNVGSSVNYYNINSYPIRNIKITCDKKAYFQNYGNDVSAIATGLSTTLSKDINPYDILEYAMKEEIFSCDRKATIEELFNVANQLYGVNARVISTYDVTTYVNEGKIVLARINPIDENENLSCGEKLIIVYSFNGKGEFNILNPSDVNNDYFCSNNTIGYGKIVKGNQSSISFSLDDLSKYVSDYYVLEVN